MMNRLQTWIANITGIGSEVERVKTELAEQHTAEVEEIKTELEEQHTSEVQEIKAELEEQRGGLEVIVEAWRSNRANERGIVSPGQSLQVAAVWACVRVLSETMASLP